MRRTFTKAFLVGLTLLVAASPTVTRAGLCEACAFGVCLPTPGVPCGVAAACSVVGVCGLSRGECLAAYKSSSTVCRAAVGPCDRTEYCTGNSPDCPSDALQPSSMVCRAASGACDRAEYCTGASASCPPDSYQPSSYVCRASAGACDRAEYCTGSSTACPADGFQPSTTVCRAASGPCDRAESCTGTSAACPADTFLPATTLCRAANGVCDAPESCTGTSAACPADAFLPASTTCRASAGPCDVAEHCTGAGASCPPDAFASASTVCRAAGGQCDAAETCSGTGPACPADARATDGTSCENASACVAGGSCAAGVCLGGTSELTFLPESVAVEPTGLTSVVIRHSGPGGAIQLTGATTDPVADFQVAVHPAWPVTLLSGEQTSVALRLAASTPGSYTGALVVAAAGCSDLTVELSGTVRAPPAKSSGGGGGGGCGHGAAGLLGLGAALILVALAPFRRRAWGRPPPRS